MEWNADAYHRVSAPQTAWGQRVLGRLRVAGDERALDAGCGTGKLTGELVARLPRGHVIAADRSINMLLAARANLRPEFGHRVSFVRVDLPALPFDESVDLVFSTATFHWIRDHERLFANIFKALRAGGRLFAQCGGGPNLARAHQLAERVMRQDAFAPYFEGWESVWEFASAAATADRLAAAGFVEIETGLEETPTTLVDEASYREFVSTVIYNPHLALLPDASFKQRFIDHITHLARSEEPPFTLDYWRLNIDATKPQRCPG